MARARNIKPGLFENEILGKADPTVTLLFISLWCLADREGRLEDRPERIKAKTFPYRMDVDIERSLNELQRSGFIIRYKVEDLKVIQVIEFCKHQSPHHTERKSTLPPCDSNSLILKVDRDLTVKERLKNEFVTVVKRSDSLISDSLISDSLIPDSLIPDSGYLITEKAPTREKDQNFEFEKFWKVYPKRPGANKTQAFKAWCARLKEGCGWEAMLDGAYRYARYCESEEVEPKFVKQASTFLGPDKHFLSDWKSSGGKANSFDNWLTGEKGGDDDLIDI